MLELGCGAGRLTGYLVELAAEGYGLDLSAAMLAECRRRYPGGTFLQGDALNLTDFADGSLDAVIAGCNLFDIFAVEERRMALREVRRVLRAGGLFVMSSHNRAYLPNVSGPADVRLGKNPFRLTLNLLRVPRRLLRHRRLIPYERHENEQSRQAEAASEVRSAPGVGGSEWARRRNR